jgi:hypothetical protein
LSENKIAQKPSIIYRQKVGLRKSAGDTSLLIAVKCILSRPAISVSFGFKLKMLSGHLIFFVCHKKAIHLTKAFTNFDISFKNKNKMTTRGNKIKIQ